MGFKEAFTRGQEEEKNLLFDDDAFFYFSISMLTIITIPVSYMVLKPLVSNFLCRKDVKHFSRVPSGAHDQKILSQVKQEQRLAWLNKSYYFKVFILAILITFLKISFSQLPHEDQIKGFDPYEILEITPPATDQQIKSAFRKMSIKLHPDKNPDDPQSAQKFIMLTKAYECLSDEKMKATCLKYGNPDGPSAFQVGIALPSFLLKKENRSAFLALIFLFLLVVVPVIVLNALSSIGKYDDNGVLRINYDIFERLLNENLIIKNCPKLIASCLEFSQVQVYGKEEDQYLNKITKDLLEEAENRKISNFDLLELIDTKKKKVMKTQSLNLKTFILSYAHLFGMDIQGLSEKDYSNIVKLTPKLIQSMIQYALQFSNRFQVERLKKSGRFFTKFMGLRCICTLLEFSQMVVQGLWEKDPDIFQISFFRNESQKYIKREKLPNFTELIRLNSAVGSLQLPNWIPEDMKKSVQEEVDLFPRLKLTTNLKIEDETVDEMTTDDFLILTISLTRENTEEGEDIPFVHSNSFTHLKEETWHVFLSFNEDIFFYKKLFGSTRVQETEYKFIPKMVFGEITDLKFTLTVKSDCYKGLDQEQALNFKIKSIKDVNRVISYHKDDEKLDQELPFMNRMLNPLIQPEPKDSDSESEDEQEKPNQTKQDKDKIE